MDIDDLDIYDDLDAFHEAEEKKTAEFLQLEDKYKGSLKTIEELKNDITNLRKQQRTIMVNFQNLLDTAKTEIKRKDGQIQQLRKEKDDICFRRKMATFPNHQQYEKVNPFKINVKVAQQSDLSNNKNKSENQPTEEPEAHVGKFNNELKRSSDEATLWQEQIRDKHHNKLRHRGDHSNRHEEVEHQKFSQTEKRLGYSLHEHKNKCESRDSSTYDDKSHRYSKYIDASKKELRRERSTERSERKHDLRREKSSSHSSEHGKKHNYEKNTRDPRDRNKASHDLHRHKSCDNDPERDHVIHSQKSNDKQGINVKYCVSHLEKTAKNIPDRAKWNIDHSERLRDTNIRDDGHDKYSTDASVSETDVRRDESKRGQSRDSDRSHSYRQDIDASKRDMRRKHSAERTERKQDLPNEKASSHSSKREKDNATEKSIKNIRDPNKASHHRRKSCSDDDRERYHVKYLHKLNDDEIKNDKNCEPYLEKLDKGSRDSTKWSRSHSDRLGNKNIRDDGHDAVASVLATDVGRKESKKPYTEKGIDHYKSNRERKKSNSSDTREHSKERTDNELSTAKSSRHNLVVGKNGNEGSSSSSGETTMQKNSHGRKFDWVNDRSEQRKESHRISNSNSKESLSENCKNRENTSKCDKESHDNNITKEQISSENIQYVVADTISLSRNSPSMSISKEISFSTIVISKPLLTNELDENSNHPVVVDILNTPKKVALFDKLFGPSPCSQNSENTKILTNVLQILNSDSTSTSPSAYSTYSDMNELEQKNGKSNDSTEQKSQSVTSAEVSSYFKENITQSEKNYQETKEHKSFFENICTEKNATPGFEKIKEISNIVTEVQNKANENKESMEQNIHFSVTENDVENSENVINEIVDIHSTVDNKDEKSEGNEKNATESINLGDQDIAVTNKEINQHNNDVDEEKQITFDKSISKHNEGALKQSSCIFDLAKEEGKVCDKVRTENVEFVLPAKQLLEIVREQTFEAINFKEVQNFSPVANTNNLKTPIACLGNDEEIVNDTEANNDHNEAVNKTENIEDFSSEKIKSQNNFDIQVTEKISEKVNRTEPNSNHILDSLTSALLETSEILEKENITAAVAVALPEVKEKGTTKSTVVTKTDVSCKNTESKIFGENNDVIVIDDDTDVDATDVDTADEEIYFYKAKLDASQSKMAINESENTNEGSKVNKAFIEIIEDIRLPSVLPINEILNARKSDDTFHTDAVENHSYGVHQNATVNENLEISQEIITKNVEICKPPQIDHLPTINFDNSIISINESFEIDNETIGKWLFSKNDTEDKDLSMKENTAFDDKEKDQTLSKKCEHAEKFKTRNEDLNDIEKNKNDVEKLYKTLAEVETISEKKVDVERSTNKEANVGEIKNNAYSTEPKSINSNDNEDINEILKKSFGKSIKAENENNKSSKIDCIKPLTQTITKINPQFAEISAMRLYDSKTSNDRSEEQYNDLKYKSVQNKETRNLNETNKDVNNTLDNTQGENSTLVWQIDKNGNDKISVETNEKSPNQMVNESIIIEDSLEVVNIFNNRTSISPNCNQYTTPKKTVTVTVQEHEIENSSKSSQANQENGVSFLLRYSTEDLTGKIPIIAPIKIPKITPIKTPIKTPIETPIETLIKTPIKAPVKKPIKTPTKKPIKTPTKKQTKTKNFVKIDFPKSRKRKLSDTNKDNKKVVMKKFKLDDENTKNIEVNIDSDCSVAYIKLEDVLKQQKRDIELELESLNKVNKNNVENIAHKSVTVETATKAENIAHKSVTVGTATKAKKENKSQINTIRKEVADPFNQNVIVDKSPKLPVAKRKPIAKKTTSTKKKQCTPKKHVTTMPKPRKRRACKMSRIYDSSSDEEIDNSSIIKAKSTEMSEQILLTMEHVVSPKRKELKDVKNCPNDKNLLYDTPTKASADVDELSPMSTAAHAIFYTDHNHDNVNELPLPQFNIIQDSQYKDIDSCLQTMFQSPPYQADKMDQLVSAQFSPTISIQKEEESFNAGILNHDQPNVTIDETISTSLLAAPATASTAEQDSLNDSNGNLEPKFISLNSSNYRLEKVSDNVVNVFITRKRRKKISK